MELELVVLTGQTDYLPNIRCNSFSICNSMGQSEPANGSVGLVQSWGLVHSSQLNGLFSYAA
jgi:hypothetical protein